MHAIVRQLRCHVAGGLLAATMLAACAGEDVAAPDVVPPVPDAAFAEAASVAQAVDLGTCDNLAAPEGSHLLAHLYTRGEQIFFWLGDRWLNIGPSAVLYADAALHSKVGVHQVSGVWESLSGSKVVGMVQRRCTTDPDAMEWQLRIALGRTGPGIFAEVDYIQIVKTEGGLAPTTPGSVYGQREYVPYAAEYLFYRAPAER